MAKRVQFREDEMRWAIAELRRCAGEFRTSARQIRTTVQQLDNDGLAGQAGDVLRQASTQKLATALERVAQKLEDRARVAERELHQMIEVSRFLR